MKLYNSYTQQLEELQPIEPGKISMYVCGPTVYNDPHIGNARPLIVFDTLKKALAVQGLEVTYASNYTDVDDKIIQAAKEEGISEKELTERYIKAYKDIRHALHADEPDYTPRVTETMDQIIDYIDGLVKKGAAYQKGGDVYFRVAADEHYGELSHQKVEDLQVGARIDENESKESPLDFTLWKSTDEGIRWDSPWSKGRPGWHTECVVMINDVFGRPTIDIHGGGLDLKFPHHENEMAQNRCTCGEPLAHTWVYNGMINIDGTKMSKSLGNVRLASDLIDLYGGNAVRWVMNSAQYRAPLNLSEESFSTANRELERIQKARTQAAIQLQLANVDTGEERDEELWNEFVAALNDDLNTPNAIAVVFETVKKLNQALRVREIDTALLGRLAHTLDEELQVLGIELDIPQMSAEDKETWKAWKVAVKAKDFETADKNRAILIEKGLV